MLTAVTNNTSRRIQTASVVLCGILLSLAGCSGTKADPNARKVAEWVLSVGGSVQVAGRPEIIKTKQHLPSGDIALTVIDLSNCKIKNNDLAKLVGLRNLKKLVLYQTPISNSGLKYVSQLKTLEELELSYTNVSNKGLQLLKPLKRLRKIYLTGTLVTDKGIEELQKSFPSLKIVKLQ